MTSLIDEIASQDRVVIGAVVIGYSVLTAVLVYAAWWGLRFAFVPWRQVPATIDAVTWRADSSSARTRVPARLGLQLAVLGWGYRTIYAQTWTLPWPEAGQNVPVRVRRARFGTAWEATL